MPKVGEIVLNPDPAFPGADTEVMFRPVRNTDGVVTFVSKSNTAPIAFPTLTVSSVPPSKTSKNTKVRLRLSVPKVIFANPQQAGFTPAPQKVGVLTADLTFVVPEISTDDERANLLLLVKRLMTHDIVGDTVQQMEQFF